MGFTDDLRNITSNTNDRELKINRVIDDMVKNWIIGIKQLCLEKAQEGKNSITGYLHYIYDMDLGPRVRVVDEKDAYLRPVKKMSGWQLSTVSSIFVAYNYASRIKFTNDEELDVVRRIREGIINELKKDGLSDVNIIVVEEVGYRTLEKKRIFNDFPKKYYYVRDNNKKNYFLKAYISWK